MGNFLCLAHLLIFFISFSFYFSIFFLSCIILESNSIHGKTVSGVRERESDASSAVRNVKERRRSPITIIYAAIATEIATEFGKEIKQSFALAFAKIMSHVRGFLEFDKVLRERPPMQYICNTTLDCMRNAPLNDEHEMSNVTDPAPEHHPAA